MIPAKWDRRDKEWMAFVHQTVLDGSTECLFCVNPADSWCHIQHGSNRTSDFLGYIACNACHHQLDHAPRSGQRNTIKESLVKGYLAEWFAFGLPPLLAEYEGLYGEESVQQNADGTSTVTYAAAPTPEYRCIYDPNPCDQELCVACPRAPDAIRAGRGRPRLPW